VTARVVIPGADEGDIRAAVSAILDAAYAHPGCDELEIVVLHSPTHVSRRNVGRSVRFQRSEVEAWLARQRKTAV
jgi:hypothetical protein